MLSLRVLISDSYNPWFNLSIEEYIFRNMDKNQSILFLWRNQNTVIIGRAQNAWKECNTRRMERDGIYLARRCSGGGAVFHDLGNTCFTFMSTQMNYNKNISFNIILKGLNNLGIPAIISGRNDIVVNTSQGQRKISGSAFLNMSDRRLHHGTLLLNVDLNKLTYYLSPDLKKLYSKGITSARARVINLQEFLPNINHKNICQQLKESFFQYYKKTVQPEIVSENNCNKMINFSNYFYKQSSWNWNFGRAPSFTHQLNNKFIWGSIELFFDVKKGIINNSYVFTDSLDPIPLEELSKNLTGKLYKTEDIQKYCQNFLKHRSVSQEIKEFIVWLIHNMK